MKTIVQILDLIFIAVLHTFFNFSPSSIYTGKAALINTINNKLFRLTRKATEYRKNWMSLLNTTRINVNPLTFLKSTIEIYIGNNNSKFSGYKYYTINYTEIRRKILDAANALFKMSA